VTTEQVVDLYLAEVARLRSEACLLKYTQILDKFMDFVGEKTPFETLTYEQGELWLSKFGGISPKTKKRYAPATQALHCSVLNNLFKFALRRRYILKPVQEFERPKLPRPEDRDVVIVSTDEIKRMFGACQTWADEICLGLLGYLGPRRNAVSVLRWKDIDTTPDPPHFPYGGLKLREKGGKIVEKPIPFVLRQILERAPEHMPDDHVVPSYRPSQITRNERKNDIIYKRVKKIAARAGVEAHPHAIRAAFAVYFLEAHKGSIRSLQELLGHESIETTRHYTRALNRRQLTSEVVDMDWGVLVSQRVGIGSESALSEEATGVLVDPLRLGTAGDCSGQGVQAPAPHHTPASSLSALSADRVESTRPVAPEREIAQQELPARSALSALSGGSERQARVSSRVADGGLAIPVAERYVASDLPESASEVVAHDMEPESLSAQFPCGIEEAHTGFEPVLRGRLSVRLGLAGTGHHLRHGTI
jgi:integrase